MIYPHQNSDLQLVNYVIGMSWRALITGGDNTPKAVKVSKDAGATHYVFDKSDRAVGYIKIPKEKKAKGAVKKSNAGSGLYSLAHAVAKAYPNSAWLLELPDTSNGEDQGYFWSCLCKNGTPVSGSDRLLTAADAADFILKNSAFLDGLSEKQFHVSINASHPAAYLTTFDSDLGSLAMGNSELESVSKGSFQFLNGANKKYWLGAAGLLLCAVAYQQFSSYQDMAAAKKVLSDRLKANADNDPAVLWKKALLQWRNEQVAPNHASLREIHEKLLTIPMTVVDWSLESVSCARKTQPNPITADQPTPDPSSLWGCTASYTRPEYPARSNNDFERVAPSDWVLGWTPLNKVAARFSLKTQAQALADEMMIAPKTFQTDVISDYQLLSKAFTSVNLAPLSNIELPKIKKSDGTVFVAPPELADQYMQSAVVVAGPLRSMELLPVRDVAWNAVAITVKSDTTEALLQQSRLNAIYTGKIYAKK
jgi:hypothetical protein